jgi:hypothetical protein
MPSRVGWLPRQSTLDAEDQIRRCNDSIPGDRTELKGSRLLKSSGHGTVVADLANGLMGVGCRPVFYLFEKRYAVAARLVDAITGPLLRWEQRATPACKVALAKALYQLPIETVAKAWNAYRAGDALFIRTSV